MRQLKGLEDIIDVSITYWILVGKDHGWEFKPDQPGCTSDPVLNAKYTADIYHESDPSYNLRYTVPILFDKKTKKIVNNESAEVIRIFNTAFDSLVEAKYKGLTFYPEKLRPDIDEVNEWVYTTINNGIFLMCKEETLSKGIGVYKTGFATSQEAYDTNVQALFSSLDKVDQILATKTYLVGDVLTEADIRLFTTIVRFDFAYYTAFKCNYKSIRHDYPNINRWLKSLYWSDTMPAFRNCTNFDHIKGYYASPSLGGQTVMPICPKYPVEPI